MLSTKRKLGGVAAFGLQRRVRPRKEEEELELESGSGSEDGSPSEDEMEGDLERGGSRSEEEEEEEADEHGSKVGPSEDEDDERPAKKSRLDLSAISFGDLARAQAALPPAGRYRKPPSPQNRIADQPPHHNSRALSASNSDATSGSDSDSDSDSPETQTTRKTGRNRHRPAELSASRAVSRKRTILSVPQRAARDPRFDTAVGGAATFSEAKARKAYAFLDDYRASEEAELRLQLRKLARKKSTSNNPDAATKKADLERQLMSMESRRKARERSEREQRILDEHRKAEKELVSQGKQPFYLKKAEQKKRLLVEQFKGMKKKQVDKVIERRRKKVAAREKRELDDLVRRR